MVLLCSAFMEKVTKRATEHDPEYSSEQSYYAPNYRNIIELFCDWLLFHTTSVNLLAIQHKKLFQVTHTYAITYNLFSSTYIKYDTFTYCDDIFI